jgi:hypothetical protein
LTRFWAISASVFLLCATAAPADEPERFLIAQNYSARESFHIRLEVNGRAEGTATIKGQVGKSTTQFRQLLLVTTTVLAVRNGAQVELSLAVDPDSHNSLTNFDGLKIWDNSLAGQTVRAHRRVDGSWISEIQGKVDPTDVTNLLSPYYAEETILPDHPVAIGDIWEPKAPGHPRLRASQQLMSQCQLDSVSTVDGKQVAQITLSMAAIQQEPNDVEMDVENSCTYHVDMETGQIISWDRQANTTFANPESNPNHVSGTLSTHDVLTAQQLPTPSTQP